jgi:hypothetical protein
MRPEHYTWLLDSCRPLADRIPAHREFIRKEGKAKDIEKRLRWDLFYSVNRAAGSMDMWVYLQNSHIDTALRAIMKEIEGGAL